MNQLDVAFKFFVLLFNGLDFFSNRALHTLEADSQATDFIFTFGIECRFVEVASGYFLRRPSQLQQW
ncbi:hypothetical protein D030_2926 [Vibrio parahaemolyticus AQ3810]|nr:hypothetical protein D030_2926 [Vibrio parahaemolyticus AQ3810]